MERKHRYTVRNEWTGNRGSGTLDYRAYARDHLISVAGKSQVIEGSSDPKFRGDAGRYNPEELFISSISACHMLWYLHLAAINGVTVLEYVDEAEGIMEEGNDGAGRFSLVTLRPVIAIAEVDKLDLADQLHHKAGEKCFIANSLNFDISYAPTTRVG